VRGWNVNAFKNRKEVLTIDLKKKARPAGKGNVFWEGGLRSGMSEIVKRRNRRPHPGEKEVFSGKGSKEKACPLGGKKEKRRSSPSQSVTDMTSARGT